MRSLSGELEEGDALHARGGPRPRRRNLATNLRCATVDVRSLTRGRRCACRGGSGWCHMTAMASESAPATPPTASATAPRTFAFAKVLSALAVASPWWIAPLLLGGLAVITRI